MRLVLVAAIVAVAVQPLAAEEIGIGIRVAGEVRAGGDGLERAQALTTDILRETGLEPRWMDCRGIRPDDDPCQRAAAPNEFVVTILPARLDRDSRGCGVSQRPLDGTPGNFITIYEDCVREGADRLFVDQATILSIAMAHEIGHLLLPPGHAFAGIMEGWADALDWQRAARGLLVFSPAEAALMREAARARQRMAATITPAG